MRHLPPPPPREVRAVTDQTFGEGGFLVLRRTEVSIEAPGIAPSDAMHYDYVERRSLDAAIVCAYDALSGHEPHVFLTSALRPPVALRSGFHAPAGWNLWEVPAGLIEPGETPEAGGARELMEELGFALSPSELMPLGPCSMPAPAICAEVQYFFAARVDDAPRTPPVGDGSPFEAHREVIRVPLAHALLACGSGEICDGKTEIALRRLADMLRR